MTIAMDFLPGKKCCPTEYLQFMLLILIHALSAQQEETQVFDVRLYGPHPWEGTVQIYIDNVWKPICTVGEDWRLQNALVICRQLGYSNAESAYVHNNISIAAFPSSVTYVDCTGLEDSLSKCTTVTGIGQACDLVHGGYAAVVCSRKTQDFSVRLNLDGKINATRGRVEVFLDNQWGTICDDGWELTAADVVCRELGFTYATVAVMEAHFGAGTGPIHKRFVDCLGTEDALKDCFSLNMTRVDGRNAGYCSHNEDAGVICSNAKSPVDFDIRLVGSVHSYIGYVQVFYQGVWGYICKGGSSWDMREAVVVCKEMGFKKALAEQVADFHQQHDYYLIDSVVCTGSEPALRACSLSIASKCSQQSATVVCSETRQPGGRPVYSIRLVDGFKPSEGRVEVFIRGKWGSVCDDSWDMIDAFVACRQLGYHYALSAPSNAAFGHGLGNIELDNIECTGVEDNLVLCDHPGIGYHDCKHREDASVICSEEPAPPIGKIVRIIGSHHSPSLFPPAFVDMGQTYTRVLLVSNGRVQVHHNNLWWRVCNDNWDDNDAKVICRQKNYRFGISLPVQQWYASDQETLLSAYINDVNCEGTEDTLADCQLGAVQPLQCPYYRDAVVYCSDNKEKLIAVKNQTGLPVRLSGGSTYKEGRVEVYSDGSWQALCWRQASGSQYYVFLWGNTAAATVVCHQLGFEYAVTTATIELIFDDSNSRNIDFFPNSLTCEGAESNLAHCQQKRLAYQCNSGQYATVQCNGVLRESSETERYDHTDTPDSPSYGFMIVMPLVACIALIFIGSICWAIRVASRSATRPCLPTWASAMIWNRPRCRQQTGQTSHSYEAVPGSEPWAPRTARTLPEHQNGEREQHVLSYYLRRQTFPSQPCRTPPPPSYRNVVQNLESFPIPLSADDDNTHGAESVEEVDLPSYSNVMSEYPEAREECFNMQQLSHNA